MTDPWDMHMYTKAYIQTRTQLPYAVAHFLHWGAHVFWPDSSKLSQFCVFGLSKWNFAPEPITKKTMHRCRWIYSPPPVSLDSFSKKHTCSISQIHYNGEAATNGISNVGFSHWFLFHGHQLLFHSCFFRFVFGSNDALACVYILWWNGLPFKHTLAHTHTHQKSFKLQKFSKNVQKNSWGKK